jgi:hypothetical protein
MMLEMMTVNYGNSLFSGNCHMVASLKTKSKRHRQPQSGEKCGKSSPKAMADTSGGRADWTGTGGALEAIINPLPTLRLVYSIRLLI